jgi:hypothetical protein
MPTVVESIAQTVNIPRTDSLTIIRDSLNALHRTDSIQQAVTDSIKHAVTQPSGFVGKALHQTVGSEAVVTILLLLLFFSYSYVFTRGRKMMLETVKDFFYLKERSSIFIDSRVNQFQLSFNFIFIFVGSLGLLFHLLFFEQNIGFSDKSFNLPFFLLLAGTILVVKYLVISFLGYIFLDKGLSSIFSRAYFTVLISLGLAIYPIVVCLVYVPERMHLSLYIVSIIISVIGFILVFYKTNQIFLDKISSFFYIILYLCTLEILPIFIVLKALT